MKLLKSSLSSVRKDRKVTDMAVSFDKVCQAFRISITLFASLKRVHRRVGEILSANHGERKAAQVNSPLGKLLSHLRGDARPILAHDLNGMEGKRNVKTHLCGRSDFPVTPGAA